MSNCADIIIIGGGVIGCATAYYLAKQGSHVIVLEGSDHIGNGGSSRNGGGVRQSGRDPRELPLAMYGIRNLWPTLSEELEVDCEYHQDGNLRLGKNEKHAENPDKSCGKGKSLRAGCPYDRRRRGSTINPYLSKEVTVASWCPTDGHANPLTTTLGFYKMARRLGVRFISGERVIRLQMIKGKIRQVITEQTVYEGEKVLVAAGFIAGKFWEPSELMCRCHSHYWNVWLQKQNRICLTRCLELQKRISTDTRPGMAPLYLAVHPDMKHLIRIMVHR